MKKDNNLNDIVFENVDSDYKSFVELHTRINEKVFTKQNIEGVTYRAINHWASKDLFFENKELERDWRKFSFVEYIWLQILINLRNMGLPLEMCHKIKRQLTKDFQLEDLFDLSDLPLTEKQKQALDLRNKKNEEDKEEIFKTIENEESIEIVEATNLLSIGIIETIVKRSHYNYFIKQDGSVVPFPMEHIELFQDQFQSIMAEHHYCISLNSLLKDFVTKDHYLKKSLSFGLLTKQEGILIDLVRQKSVVSIKVKKEKQQIELIETTEKLNSMKLEGRLMDYFLKTGYQTITTTTQNGHLVYAERITKHKI